MTRGAVPSVSRIVLAMMLPLLVGGCGWVAVGNPAGPVDPMARRSGGGYDTATIAAPPPAPSGRSGEVVKALPPLAPQPSGSVEVRELAPPPPPSRSAPPQADPPSSPAPRTAAAAAVPPPPAPLATARPAPTTARQAPSAPAGGRVVVQPGDTVYAISRRTRVSVKGLIVANDLRAPYVVRPGQELRLPPPPLVHMVQAGDTMYSVSRRYGVDTTSLARANGLSPPYTIRVGEGLVIPDGTFPPTSAAASATPPAPTAGGAPKSLMERPAPGPAVAVAEPPPATGRGFLLPVQGRIVSGFGPKPGGLHNDGINIAATRGTPVRAAENGVVAYAGNELPGFGNLVIVKHDDGWMTAYGHNEAILVKRGQRVGRGESIARVGSTGNVGEPQLHFELRRGARAVDPKSYFVAG